MNVFQVFDSANLDRCRFYIGMSAFLIFFFFVVTLVSQNNDWLILAGISILGWLIAMAFWAGQRRKIREFLRAHPLHEPYRCIDTTFFSEQEILSASLDKLTYCRYDAAWLQRNTYRKCFDKAGSDSDSRQRWTAGGTAGPLDQREESGQWDSAAGGAG